MSGLAVTCNVPPPCTSVTLNRVCSRLAQRSPGIETRFRRLGHPLKNRRCPFGSLCPERVPHQTKHQSLKMSAGCLILTSSAEAYSCLYACILARRTRVQLQELNSLETVEKRRWSIEMPSKGRRPISATLGSFFLLQKLDITSNLLIRTSSCIRKNEKGGGAGVYKECKP